jgi:hypothetical protein
MPVRIEWDELSVNERVFAQSPSAFNLPDAAPGGLQLPIGFAIGYELQDALKECCTPKYQPKTYTREFVSPVRTKERAFEFASPIKTKEPALDFASPIKKKERALDFSSPIKTKERALDFSSPATSTTTVDYDHYDQISTDHTDHDYPECNSKGSKESEASFSAGEQDCPCFIPFVDPLDWDDVAEADRRIFVASELIDLLAQHGGQLLLSKVGSVLTDETRRALRDLRIRLLTFLKEHPQKKYFRIDGAGGGQVLSLRDLRDLAGSSEESNSLDDVRAELHNILGPYRRRNALLLRSLGSSLSHSSKMALKANRLSLSQFLALDNGFVVRKNHVYLAETDFAAVDLKVLSAPAPSSIDSRVSRSS